MAEILQVSRTSVREALRVMEIMGIIQINVGKGIFVGDLSTQSMAQAISSSIMFEQKNIEQLFEVREMLEIKIVSLASLRATEENVERIRQAEEQVKESLNNPNSSINEEKYFHLALAKATHNDILFSIMYLILDSYLDPIISKSGKAGKKRTRQKAAEEAMKYHIQKSLTESRSILYE